MGTNRRTLIAVAVAMVAVCTIAPAAGAQDLVVYDDGLAAGFGDWSWATHNLANSSPIYSGSASISMEPDAWEAVWLHSDTSLAVADYEAVRLWVSGQPGGGQQLRLHLWLGNSGLADVAIDDLVPGGVPASGWAMVEASFADLGLTSGVFDGILVQDDNGGDQAPVFLDDVVLVARTGPPPPPTTIAITVDPGAELRPIDPRIYGVSFGPSGPDVPAYPVRRWGGNSVTRYNWQADVSNKGSDWFFFNIPEATPDPSQLPDGSTADLFVDDAFAASGEPLMTVPTIGWTPMPVREKRWGFSVSDYGPQTVTECSYFSEPPAWCTADAGNGECGGANTTGYCVDGQIVGNDPLDTSIPIGPSFTTDWMAHLAGRVGTAAEGGVRLWALDNEPMLWNSTHRDVHPGPATYDEVWTAGLAVAQAIKAADPAAITLGPVVWGWCAYFSSAADAAYPNGSCIDGPDRQAHGGLPFLQWYLRQSCAVEQSTGTRPVDMLDVHFYPQGGVSGLEGDGEDPATAAKRLRSIKELYDPSYVSESWIGQPIELIPMLRRWIDAECPGMGLAITEYRWGADDGPSGALAQAEVLAIFGREGVDLAARWVAPDHGTRTEEAFRLFLDYDGAGSRVEGMAVAATSADVDAVGAYAVRAPGDSLLVLLFNKDTASRQAEVAVAGTLMGDGTIYRFDAASPVGPAGTVTPTGSGFTLELPARSATLVRIAIGTGSLFADDFETGTTAAWSAVAGG